MGRCRSSGWDKSSRTQRVTVPRKGTAAVAAIHFAQDFSISTSFTWISADAAEALHALGHEVTVQRGEIAASVEPQTRELLRRLQTEPSSQAAHVKWTHFWTPYLRQPLNGRVNLEIVALNHALARPTGAASDRWMQAVRDSTAQKLAISQFTRATLLQNGVDPDRIDVWNLGYTPEIDTVTDARELAAPGYRFLHITNSTDPLRFGTDLAFATEFGPDDDVCLVVKDYNPADATVRDMLAAASLRAPVLYLPEFSSRSDLVRTYRACDALVAPLRGEGYGIKVLDALACGLPVIAPLFGGISDFCNHERIFPLDHRVTDAAACVDVATLGTNGRPVWCEPDHDSLRARMREVVANPRRAESRGRAAERYVKRWFGWPDAARNLIEIVKRLEATDGQARPADSPTAAGLLV